MIDFRMAFYLNDNLIYLVNSDIEKIEIIDNKVFIPFIEFIKRACTYDFNCLKCFSYIMNNKTEFYKIENKKLINFLKNFYNDIINKTVFSNEINKKIKAISKESIEFLKNQDIKNFYDYQYKIKFLENFKNDILENSYITKEYDFPFDELYSDINIQKIIEKFSV